jgi:predicted aminopeptidase
VRLGIGQTDLLLSREPITPELIATLEPKEQQNLEALQRALDFGESLGLPRTTSYRDLVGNKESGLVHVVTAAPANRMEALAWWFPITGSVTYRGYFERERADDFAADLARDGYDTFVRPAPLYSTLGWFDDPVPRGVLGWPEELVVDTFLHELVHQSVFVASDVPYNEALATFIAHHATLAFYADRPESRARAEAAFADELIFAEMLRALRVELEAAYAANPTPEEARALRAPIFARYQTEVYAALPWRSARYARFPSLALSNAWLVAQQDYVGELPCFEEELAALGGDLPTFIRAHEADPGHRSGACDVGGDTGK